MNGISYHFRRAARSARKWLWRQQAARAIVGNSSVSANTAMPKFRRYLSDQPGDTEAYLAAASDYVANKNEAEYAWLYCKPYERKPGNEAFYSEMYQVMNLLRAMNVPYGGRILEVGSGPGWVTEILVSLGYEVHGLEPSEDMIAIAQERVSSAIAHWRIQRPPHFAFFCQTLENCSLPGDEYDGIIFHAALHHIIDEEAGFAQCYRLLRPGGVLGISEAAWEPGNKALEALLDDEMERFGTLENPYTQEYLDYLLARHGFVDVERFHCINGFIPASRGHLSVEALADAPAQGTNNLRAVKQGKPKPTTRDHSAITLAEIQILEARILPELSRLHAMVKLKNRGETRWLHEGKTAGWVTVAVRTEPLGGAHYQELARTALPKDIDPGEEIILDLDLELPGNHGAVDWHVDLVNEEIFWFSTRGTRAPLLTLDRKPTEGGA